MRAEVDGRSRSLRGQIGGANVARSEFRQADVESRFSIPLALLFLCAGAAAAALITLGIDTSQALAATVAIGSLGVLSGAAALLGAIARHPASRWWTRTTR